MSVTSPGPGSASLRTCGPRSWCQGAWQNLPELQVTRAKQACRWHCPPNLSVHGEWAFRPLTPTKESCLALGGPPYPALPGSRRRPAPRLRPKLQGPAPRLASPAVTADPQGCSKPPLLGALGRPEGLRSSRQPSAGSSREKHLGTRPGARSAQGPSPGCAVLQAELSEKTPPAAARRCRTAAFPTHSMNF